MRKRMFVVPGSFVPFNDTVTLLTYKRLRGLDLDMDVFCFSGTKDAGLEEELKRDENFKKFHIVETTDYDWAIARNHPLRLPFSLFYMNRYVHDSLKQFEKGTYDYLFTSIVPGISHIAGLKIKKKHPEVRWYASFSDPFKGSPYKNSDLSGKSLIYRIAFKVGAWALYNDRYEEAAVLNADKLIFICEEQRDFTLSRYPDSEKLKQKSIIMPLTYIPGWKMYDDILDAPPVHNEPKKAVHLGRLYGLRKIDPFVEALRQLKDQMPDLSKKIVFHQYSEIQPEDVKKIREYGLDDLFVIHDKVSYSESIRIMKEADILVLFDTLMPEAKLQPYLPSKIVEYLLLRKPILAVCGDNSPSFRILKGYGFDTIGCDTDRIKQNICSLLEEERKTDHPLDGLSCENYDMLEL